MSGFGHYFTPPAAAPTERPICAYDRCGRPATHLLKRVKDGKAVVEAACLQHRALLLLGGDEVELIPEKAT